jgi:DNA-binding GntR family transcriptional regulator
MLADLDQRYKEFSALDERFHLLIHRAARNRFIADFYDAIAIVFHYHYQWNKALPASATSAPSTSIWIISQPWNPRDQAAIEFSCRLHLRSARQTLLQSLPQPAPTPGRPSRQLRCDVYEVGPV